MYSNNDDTAEVSDAPIAFVAAGATPKRKAKTKRPAKSKAKTTAKRKTSRPAKSKRKGSKLGPRASVDIRVLSAAKKAAPEKTIFAALQKAFGKGRTVGAALAHLEKNWEPPRSHLYESNPRRYVLGYVSKATVLGYLGYGKA